jgi:hypothetical protein
VITELLNQPGSFEFSLREGTPLDVRKAIPYRVVVPIVIGPTTYYFDVPFGHVIVTPNRLPEQTLTHANLLAQAIYHGRIQTRSNQMHTFGGHHITVWMGDAENKGDSSRPVFLVASTFATYLDYLINTAGIRSGPCNGITIGSGTGATATTRVHDDYSTTDCALSATNRFAAATGNEWRLNHDGSIDYSAIGSLFNATPTVYLLRTGGGPDGTVTGLEVSSLEVSEDFDDYRQSVTCYGSSSSVGSQTITGSTQPYSFDGTTLGDVRHVMTSSATTNTDCATDASTDLNLNRYTRREISCSVITRNIRRLCEPGDYVYIYDQATDLVDTSNQVTFRGRTLYPVKVQLAGYTWPITAGMGVYTIQTQDGTNAITDISDWIEWETGDVKLEIEAGRRPAPGFTS